jgi:UDP-glucuronate decarboxylase
VELAQNRIVREDVARIVSAVVPWQDLAGATILITGAAGLLPSYLVETLVHLNTAVLPKPVRIVALVRNAATATARFRQHLEQGRIELLVRDVCEPLPDQLRFDYIIHAASQASPRYYGVDPVGTLAPNVVGTSNLLAAAARSPVRGFLFMSSGDVYGILPESTRVFGERDFGHLDCATVRSCYGESKRMGETMCVAWAHQFGVPTRIARPFHTYGPGMRLDDGRVFADFVRDILAGGPIVLHSDGFCYIADATEAFFRILLTGETPEAYNVANAKADVSVAELAELLARQFGVRIERAPRTGDGYLPSPIPFSRPDIAKIGRLGWEPATGLEEGFARTVESYRIATESKDGANES